MRKILARFSPLVKPGGPCARSSHGVSTVKDHLYIIGGEREARTPLDMTVHVLPTEAGPPSEWRTIAPDPARSPPPRIAHAQAAISDSELLMFGGRAGMQMEEAALNDLWSLDTASESWSPIEPVSGEPPCPRSFHAATSFGSKFYVFGGCGESGRLADLHSFDTTTRAWRRLPDPPGDVAGRGGASLEASADGSSLWLIGGFAGVETNDILRFDVASEAWTRVKSDWLRPRSVCSSFRVGGAVFCFGGEVSPSDRGHEGAGGFASDLVAIDATSGMQLEVAMASDAPAGYVPQLPAARGWGSATAISKNSAVLFGGLAGDDANPERLDDMWVVTLRLQALRPW